MVPPNLQEIPDISCATLQKFWDDTGFIPNTYSRDKASLVSPSNNGETKNKPKTHNKPQNQC